MWSVEDILDRRGAYPVQAAKDIEWLASKLEQLEAERQERDELRSRLDHITSTLRGWRDNRMISLHDRLGDSFCEAITKLIEPVVEKHERDCCEWHKAGGDLEYPCNRV